MRIAFIVDRFPVLSETFILNQITGLIDRGHQVDIYSNKLGNTTKVHPDVDKYQLLKRTYFLCDVPQNYFQRFWQGVVLVITNFHKGPLTVVRSLNIFKYGKWAASLRLLYSTVNLLNTSPYDIIHCQFGMHGIEGMMYRSFGAIKGKLITSFRGFDISWYIKQEGEHVYDQLLKEGDFFLTNCEFFRQRAIKLGCHENKIIVHGSGIDCQRFRFQPRHPHADGKIRIASTGRLLEKKGIEYVIRAIPILAQDYPKIEYNIIGDGHLKAYFEQVIEELNIADKVNLLGWKNQEEIIDILDNSDIFVAPSVTARDGNQDAPVNTLKEAMAMGLPVIGTFHGGIPELIEDGISGFLVPERDEIAIAQKLSYFIEHPEIWEEMGRAGRAHVELHYDMHKLNDELVKIYQQVAMNKLPISFKPISVARTGEYTRQTASK